MRPRPHGRHLGNRLLSKREYYALSALGAVLVLVAVGCVAVCFAYWQELEWAYRVALVSIAALLSPTLGDVRSLFLPYGSYRKDWLDARPGEDGH